MNEKNLEYPFLSEVRGNLVLTKERVPIAYYKIESEPLMLIDEKNAEKIKKKVARVLKKFKLNKGFEIHLVPFDMDFKGKMTDLAEISSDEHEGVVLNHCARLTERIVKEMYIPYEYKWVVGIPLQKKDFAMDLKEVVKDKANDFGEILVNGFGYELALAENWEEKYKYQEQEVFQTLSELRVERLTKEKIYQLQAEQFLPYIPHELSDVTNSSSVANLQETVFNVGLTGDLHLRNSLGESYVAVMPLGDMGIDLENKNVLSFLQLFDFPIHAVFQARFSEKKGASSLFGRSNRAKSRTKAIFEETEISGGSHKKKILEGYKTLLDLDEKLDNEEPILDWQAYFIVSGRTLSELKARKKALLNSFHNNKIDVYRATWHGWYLFQQCLYGNFLRMENKRWVHTSTLETFSRLDFFTTQEAGNGEGYLIGRVDMDLNPKKDVQEICQRSNKLFFENLLLGNKQGKKGKKTHNPHYGVFGVTGSGKSVLFKIRFLEAMKLGAKVLYIDPKKEIRERFQFNSNSELFKQKYPETKKLVDKIHYITLDFMNKDNLGVLDPIVIFSEGKALEVAISILLFISEEKYSRNEITKISDSVKTILKRKNKGETVGFWHVIDELKAYEEKEIKILGEYFQTIVEGSILELCFSRGEVATLSLDKQATVLEIERLDLPESKNDSMTMRQRLTVALMISLGAFCELFGSMDKKEETFVLFDEAWIFTKSDTGKGILKSMLRVGRSENNTLGFASQSVDDGKFSTDDEMAFGTISCFAEPNNQEGILNFLNIPVTPVSLKWVDDMVQGQCLHLDMFGNLNRIGIEIPYEEYLELFKTVEETKASLLESKSF